MSDEMTESMRMSMSLEGDAGKLKTFYDDWATSYDTDVASHGYGLPDSLVGTMLEAIDKMMVSNPEAAAFRDPEVAIVDAGCGTGQVGRALHEAGYRNIAGVDLSAEMVQVASTTGYYRNLLPNIDLTVSAPGGQMHQASIVTVGGVFTVGHIPPSSLEAILSWVKPGGLVVTSTRKSYQVETGYQEVVGGLIETGVLELILHNAELPYTMDSTGDYWVYRVA